MKTIGIITINKNINLKQYIEHFNTYKIIIYDFSSSREIAFDNILKFKTILKNKEKLKICEYLIFVNCEIEIELFKLLFPILDETDNKIKTINYSGDIFSGNTNKIMELSVIINTHIQNDLKYDINVTKWNYQINKYFKLYPDVINHQIEKKINILNLIANKNNYATVHLIGGLGNLLFQIFAVYHYSKLHNVIPIFCIKKNNDKRPSICKYRLFDNLKKYSPHDNLIFNNVDETKFNIEIENNSNVKLIGLFQKYLHFQKTKNIFDTKEILNFDDFKYDIFNYLSNKMTNVSIHVRRTDYLKCNIYNILNEDYYLFATSQFNKMTTHFLIFSDDINWCKKSGYFSNLENYAFIDNTLSDEEQLYLMSKCDHNIIANSTYSLWGYYLNLNPNKILVMPKKWFLNKNDFDLNDLGCNDFNVVLF